MKREIGESMRPRLGVLDFNPIQYHAPLYQQLAKRGIVELDVLFLSDKGYRAEIDHGFGVPVAWDIDLLSGYAHGFLRTAERSDGVTRRLRALAQWVPSHDVVVVHGHANPWMLFGTVVCRSRRLPYLLRGDSHPVGQSSGLRCLLRHVVARAVVSGCAGGLAVGELNEKFYRRYGAPMITFAPHSVDDERFSGPPSSGRAEVLGRLGLASDTKIILYCGKLVPSKRPLDLVAAVRLLSQEVSTIFVGDGSLAAQVRTSLRSAHGAVTGFVNQLELPSLYHAADILVLPSEVEPWGLVVNEAMAAGVLPVVSDRVGAGPDLVRGLGEVYPCGDVSGLADALRRALVRVQDLTIRDRVRQHVARYSLDRTVAGYEQATLAILQGR